MTELPTQASFVQTYHICAAVAPWQQAGAADLRTRVFVQEQGLFSGHDRDGIDEVAMPLVAVAEGASGGPVVAGTVRIHEAAPGIWWGSRLAVAPEWRRVGKLGSELIRLAVGIAHARGAVEFHAHVQAQNVVLFRRLHWAVMAEVDLHGRPHAHMLADLCHYPAIENPALGWRILASGAAR